MSYDNSSTSALLTRTVGLGHITMFWGRTLSYPASFWALLYAPANFDTLQIGSDPGNPNPATTLNIEAGGTAQLVATGSNTSWVFVCAVADDTVAFNYQVFWRFEGETTLHSGTLGSKSAGGFVELWLMNNPPASNNIHCRVTAYKEWTAFNNLGTGATLTANVLAESAQNAPVITAGNCNYLSCAVGSTIGQDTSPSGNNWTVSGTITTNADEPNMNIAPGGVAINAVGLHYVTA